MMPTRYWPFARPGTKYLEITNNTGKKLSELVELVDSEYVMGIKASKLSKLMGIGLVGKRLKPAGAAVMTPRGYVPVVVGVNLNESKRFMVHTTALYDAEFLEMLSRSAEEYGFRNQGILRIPYETKAFEERMFNVGICAGGSNRISPKIRGLE